MSPYDPPPSLNVAHSKLSVFLLASYYIFKSPNRILRISVGSVGVWRSYASDKIGVKEGTEEEESKLKMSAVVGRMR